MDPRHLEAAAEFCSLVGAPHLLAYLGLDASCDPEEARNRLRERRKFMQGMQANPKYKQEAVTLIRHMQAFHDLLANPGQYLDAVRRAEELTQLPVLEITIRGMLKGGSLTHEQEEYLRRNAHQMGISRTTFDLTLQRLAAEVGAPLGAPPAPGPRLPSLPPQPSPVRSRSSEPPPPQLPSRPPTERSAERAISRPPEDAGPRAADRLPAPHSENRLGSRPPHFELLNPTGAQGRPTGPPARSREAGPDPVLGAPTAPPVRLRHHDPSPGRATPETDPFVRARNRQARNRTRVEVIGDTVRRVSLKTKKVATRFTVQVSGGGGARVSTDQAWLLAEPQRIEPGVESATIEVRIDPQGFVGPRGTGVVSVQTQDGDRANVAFEVERVVGLSPLTVAGAIGLVAVIAIAAIGSSLLPIWGPGRGATLTIEVDPTAEHVRIDGIAVGSGPVVRVENPPLGIVWVAVDQPRFKPYQTQFEVPPGKDSAIKLTLELAEPLDFVPDPTMSRASLDTAVVRRVMQPSTRDFDTCIRAGIPLGKSAQGSIRIHVSEDGLPVGLDGDPPSTDPAVFKCLERRIALLEFPALTDGSYATVRYDFNLSRETDR